MLKIHSQEDNGGIIVPKEFKLPTAYETDQRIRSLVDPDPSAIYPHNTSSIAHPDIRNLINSGYRGKMEFICDVDPTSVARGLWDTAGAQIGDHCIFEDTYFEWDGAAWDNQKPISPPLANGNMFGISRKFYSNGAFSANGGKAYWNAYGGSLGSWDFYEDKAETIAGGVKIPDWGQLENPLQIFDRVVTLSVAAGVEFSVRPFNSPDVVLPFPSTAPDGSFAVVYLYMESSVTNVIESVFNGWLRNITSGEYCQMSVPSGHLYCSTAVNPRKVTYGIFSKEALPVNNGDTIHLGGDAILAKHMTTAGDLYLNISVFIIPSKI